MRKKDTNRIRVTVFGRRPAGGVGAPAPGTPLRRRRGAAQAGGGRRRLAAGSVTVASWRQGSAINNTAQVVRVY